MAFSQLKNDSTDNAIFGSTIFDDYRSEAVVLNPDLTLTLKSGSVALPFSEKQSKIDENSCVFCMTSLEKEHHIQMTKEIKTICENFIQIELKDDAKATQKSCLQCLLEIHRCGILRKRILKIQDKMLKSIKTPDLPIKQEPEYDDFGEFGIYEILEEVHLKEEDERPLNERLNDSKKTKKLKKKVENKSPKTKSPKKRESTSKGTVKFICPSKPMSKEDKEKIPCPICGILITKWAMNNHNYYYHPELLNTKKTKDRSRAKEIIQCPHCNLNISRWSLGRHIQRKHEQRVDFECDFCGSKKFKKDEMIRHMITHHVKEREIVNCSFDGCSLTFNRIENLNQHIRKVHLGIFRVCEICGKQCANGNYSVHMKTKHSNERNYCCSNCSPPKFFKDAGSLRAHNLMTHEREEKTCEICGTILANIFTYRIHKRQMHSEKKFQCSICPQGFAVEYMFKKHMERHSGIKKSSCSLCDSTFFNNALLKEHISAKHLNFKFECEVAGCSAKYTLKNALKKHVRATHATLSAEWIKVIMENIDKMKFPDMSEFLKKI